MSEKIGIVTWLWQAHEGYEFSYTVDHANTFYKMFKRNCTLPVEFYCVTDQVNNLLPEIKTIPLWSVPAPIIENKLKPNCYRRLKMFSSQAKEIFKVDRVISFDIDAVITSNIDHIIKREEDFIGWRNIGGVPYQGSLTSYKIGTRNFIWEDYIKNPTEARQKASYFIGSDQAWVSHRLGQHEAVYSIEDGVYSYKTSLQNLENKIPKNLCIAFFHGFPKPWTSGMNNLLWIKENYK